MTTAITLTLVTQLILRPTPTYYVGYWDFSSMVAITDSQLSKEAKNIRKLLMAGLSKQCFKSGIELLKAKPSDIGLIRFCAASAETDKEATSVLRILMKESSIPIQTKAGSNSQMLQAFDIAMQ